MARVYIETTIPSYYFETRTSIRALAWREATRRWWTRHRSHYQLVTSEFVLNEMADAPRGKADLGLALLSAVVVLPQPPDLAGVIAEHIRRRLMPGDAVGDAAHLAMTSLHGVDYLLTWNCKHWPMRTRPRTSVRPTRLSAFRFLC
jgi:hypothetical protein